MDDLSENPAKRNMNLPKILNGTFFEVIENDEKKLPNIKAKCTTCGSVRSAAINGTGNLIKHYKDAHPTLHGQLLEYIKPRSIISFMPKAKQSNLEFNELHPDKVDSSSQIVHRIFSMCR